MSDLQGELIGEGTFGKVYKIKDATGKHWAVKQMKCKQQQQGIPACALREITLLKNLKGHPNVIEIGEITMNKKQDKTQIRVYFNYCEYDLKRFLRENQQILPLPLIKKIIKEILRGVSFMHSKRIMHRDLKPQNILLDSDKIAKIADFGLARMILPTQKTLTRQVQTLYYRAPEIMFGSKYYGYGVDIWAVGCILAQLFLKRPLFLGGSCQIQQIFKVFEILGTPLKGEWPNYTELEYSSPKYPKWKKQSLSELIKNIPQQGIDLLEKMLDYNPVRRITAENALKHKFFIE